MADEIIKVRKRWPFNPKTKVKPLTKKPKLRERREKDSLRKFIEEETSETD